MQSALEREIDFRVALLDYFVDINRKIKNPKIIEIRIFQKTQQETFVDELTQLYNYRYFERALKDEVLRSHRYNAPLSLVICDVDDFKHYNDINGHLAGNNALKKLAAIIKKVIRDVDIATRYGGEEFALILPETNKEGAYVMSERIRKNVDRSKFFKGKMQPLKRFSISGGVATLGVDADSAEELIKRADQALYIAKSRGKNQTALFEQERRDSERVNATIIGRLSLATSVGEMFEVRNISESGVLFNYPKALTIGNILQLSLTLPNRKTPLNCKAKLMRSKELRTNKEYELGARFVGVRDPDKKALTRFLRSIG
jgi:diguanylate cyclase (GGDEF)-like protein